MDNLRDLGKMSKLFKEGHSTSLLSSREPIDDEIGRRRKSLREAAFGASSNWLIIIIRVN